MEMLCVWGVVLSGRGALFIDHASSARRLDAAAVGDTMKNN